MVRTSQLWRICREMAEACVYLQKKGIIHGDIAARNCLLQRNDPSDFGRVKLADFGLAKLQKEVEIMSDITPDPIPFGWAAVELLDGRDNIVQFFSSMSDVWSFGVLMFEVFSWVNYCGFFYAAISVQYTVYSIQS